MFRRVRGANPSARVILMAGYRDEMGPLVGRLLDEGVAAVPYKPFDIPRLIEDPGHRSGGGGGA